MNKSTKNIGITLIGFLLLTAGLLMTRWDGASQGGLRNLPYVLVGIGCGMLGRGLDKFLCEWSLRKSPDMEKSLKIDREDERNVEIVFRSKAKAYDLMVPAFGALLLTFALIGVDLAPVLLLVFAYLLVMGYSLYWRIRYDREM